MSKLSELLNKLCPNGVEYKSIGEIGTLTRGKRFVHADAVEEGIPCIHYGELYTYYGISTTITKSFVREDLAPKLRYARKNDVVIVGAGENDWDIGIAVAYLGDKEVAVHDACYIFRQENDPKYISYCLRTTDYHQQIKKYVSTGKICAISSEGLSKAIIPVPPMEVQHEIVQILDKLTLLSVELSAELSAEFSARRKQYEYYKSCMFKFDEGGPKKRIGDFTKVFSASRVHKKDWKSDGVPFWRSSDLISYFNGVDNSRGKVYISQELYEALSARSGKIEKDDILVTGGGTIGIPYVVPSDDPMYVKDADLLCIKKNNVVLTKYLYHYFLSQEFRDYLMGITHDATIAHYTITQIKDTPVPVPTIEEQARIVKILDEFENLNKSIKLGLPAEIEARQKQYEYYRDKLLSFKIANE